VKLAWTLSLLAPLLLATCGSRTIAMVQEHHGREFRCDRRYVRVERGDGERWVSRGCGFEADWDCRDRRCDLRDARAHGVSGP
jgi:hypothetical protein